jgi:alpha-galactosidase
MNYRCKPHGDGRGLSKAMDQSQCPGVRARSSRRRVAVLCFALAQLALCCFSSSAQNMASESALKIRIDSSSGELSVTGPESNGAVLRSSISAEVDGSWLSISSYPRHEVRESSVQSSLGPAHQWIVSFSGLSNHPDLEYQVRAAANAPFVEIWASVRNSTNQPIHIERIRPIDAAGVSILELGGPASQDRVLSDSFSEDHPQLQIQDLSGMRGVHQAYGSQLIYNRKSGQSFFIGATTSDRFLSTMNLTVKDAGAQASIASYTVESTGVTEYQKKYSLEHASAADQIELNLPLAPGETMNSERLVVGISHDYHHQLEFYGELVRKLHNARVTTASAMGWWSWTAYYFGLNEATALSNAQWLAQHLKSLGYDFFHIDEGYQFARGEYSTPDAALFPHGMTALENQVRSLGLVAGIWTAPFQVSERSWVFQHHPDWLVANAKGAPIQLGFVTDKNDRLYVLDPTHPEAQDYLRKTYTVLTKEWGMRYIKLDFMDDAAIEGYYHRPNTTAMEAQRIGLSVIREAVGEDVLLDKDGSPMLNPVGLVDTGRISQDTGHTFGATKDAASGVAARYYMNRNFFVSDPDAYSVSTQYLKEQTWHGGEQPITLEEAKASIALSAVSGGMYEIGDDLPRLSSEPDRLALIENQDLINMARLGKASVPVDLMTYLPEDQQPSIYYLQETPRQGILTCFNWTDVPRLHTVSVARLGMSPGLHYTIRDVFDNRMLNSLKGDKLTILQPAHSARVLMIRTLSKPVAPHFKQTHEATGKTGSSIRFTANPNDSNDAIVGYHWDFGDGIKAEGASVTHAYTTPGEYTIKVSADGVEGASRSDRSIINISGGIQTLFHPAEKVRQSSHD